MSEELKDTENLYLLFVKFVLSFSFLFSFLFFYPLFLSFFLCLSIYSFIYHCGFIFLYLIRKKYTGETSNALNVILSVLKDVHKRLDEIVAKYFFSLLLVYGFKICLRKFNSKYIFIYVIEKEYSCNVLFESIFTILDVILFSFIHDIISSMNRHSFAFFFKVSVY